MKVVKQLAVRGKPELPNERRLGDEEHQQGKEMQKAKWLSEEALQIAVKRKVKGKGEKERYSHVNAEFQRIARRDKKAFLSDQSMQRNRGKQ